MNLIDLAERAMLPDWLIRVGIRRLLAARLASEAARDGGQPRGSLRGFVDELRRSPIAVAADSANIQHYEVPTDFFRRILGPRMKYSSCYWPNPEMTLAEAEESMLDRFCRSAGIEEGMDILELGCGWGSLCLWIAEKYPRCSVLALSNSSTQREFILTQCAERSIRNIEVLTVNAAHFDTDRRFDRVLSVEMFEHIRNYQELLRRIADWLKPEGRLMVHIFCHARYAYAYETEGESDWMARHFFTGGIMPSDDLLLYFQHDLVLEEQWRFSGVHYARTLEAWLDNLDRQRADLLCLFQATRGRTVAARELQRWRMFLMACSELFNYREGLEWWVSHYLFRKRAAGRQDS